MSVVDTWGISSIPDEHEFDLGLQQLVGDIYTEKAFPTIQSGQQQKSNNSRLVAPLERIEQSARSELVPRGLTSKVRPRGRALGSHLEPKVAKAARDMRKTVACWHCVLQRDKVCSFCANKSYTYLICFYSVVLAIYASDASSDRIAAAWTRKSPINASGHIS